MSWRPSPAAFPFTNSDANIHTHVFLSFAFAVVCSKSATNEGVPHLRRGFMRLRWECILFPASSCCCSCSCFRCCRCSCRCLSLPLLPTPHSLLPVAPHPVQSLHTTPLHRSTT